MAGRPMAVQSLPEIFGQVENIVLAEIFLIAQILVLLIKRIPTNPFLKIIVVLTDHCLTLILSDLTTIFGLLIKSRTNKFFTYHKNILFPPILNLFLPLTKYYDFNEILALRSLHLTILVPRNLVSLMYTAILRILIISY